MNITTILRYLINIKKWQSIEWRVLVNHPIFTLLVTSPVIFGAILGILAAGPLSKLLLKKLREKYPRDENAKMDKKRFVRMIIFMILPFIFGILLVILFTRS